MSIELIMRLLKHLAIRIALFLSNKFELHPAFVYLIILNLLAVVVFVVANDGNNIETLIVAVWGTCFVVVGLNILSNPVLRNNERKVKNQNHTQITLIASLRQNSKLDRVAQAKYTFCSHCGSNLGVNVKFCSSWGTGA